MRKNCVGRKRSTLSTIMDSESEGSHTSWAITQQHGNTVNKSSSEVKSRKSRETRQTHESDKGGKQEAKKDVGESGRIRLPVLGSLSMNIETHNPFETDKKSNHEALYRNKLLRTKKQKSIEGMFQAAKANKELSQILLNMNPSFNLDITEHNLHKFLAPRRHIASQDIADEKECLAEPTSPPPQETVSEEPSQDTDPVPDLPPANKLLPVLTTKPAVPPPLTSNDLIRRAKVIQAIGPSTLWIPGKSLEPQPGKIASQSCS